MSYLRHCKEMVVVVVRRMSYKVSTWSC